MMLNHLRVLVTRPSPQGEALCAFIQVHGGEPIFFPVMRIQLIANTDRLEEQIRHLDHYDWAIFVSRHAVAMTASLIHQHWPQLPPRLKIVAIGEGTAQALQQAKLPVTIYPTSQWSTEGLLHLPEFQAISQKKMALFCGVGGRELLMTTLQARGASITPFISYQRVMSEVDVRPYLDLLQNKQIDVIVCTSGEGVTHLKKLLGERGWPLLQKIPLVLVSERIMILAKELGFETCLLAKNASHEGILDVLKRSCNVSR